MKRTTIFADEKMLSALRRQAEEESRSVAEIVREAIANYLAAKRPEPGAPSLLGIGQSGRTDVAERHEELLWKAGRAQEKA